MPEFVVDEPAHHLAHYRDPDGWVFSAPQGRHLRAAWDACVEALAAFAGIIRAATTIPQ
jgi:hypothetical protein